MSLVSQETLAIEQVFAFQIPLVLNTGEPVPEAELNDCFQRVRDEFDHFTIFQGVLGFWQNKLEAAVRIEIWTTADRRESLLQLVREIGLRLKQEEMFLLEWNGQVERIRL